MTSKLRLTKVGILFAVVAAATFSSASSSSAGSTATVNIEGHGYGHGRGMGQFGALGYALNHGWSHATILDHFYGGTVAGNIGDIHMSVRLTKFDGRATVLQMESSGLLTSAAAGTYGALRAVKIGTNLFRVEATSYPGCFKTDWSVINASVAGPIVFSPSTRDDNLYNMIQACEPDGTSRWLRGDIRAVDANASGDAGQRTINDLSNEAYLRGVVPRESPASWGDLGNGAGMNALRAQSVAARSYAAAENRYPSYTTKTCDTESCQVYKGRAEWHISHGKVIDKEDGRTNQAIAETAGLVRLKNGSVARTEFSSSTGGWTAGGNFPAVPDDGDRISSNSNHHWRVGIAASRIEAAWPSIGTYLSMVVTRRNGLGDWGGRVQEVRINGTSGSTVQSGNSVRLALGLKSDWFNVMSGWESLGGSLTSGPDVSSWDAGRLDIFARGDDGSLIHKWWDGRAWHGWESLGGFLTSDPAVISWGPNRIDVFVRGSDGAMWQKWWDGVRWNGWMSHGGYLEGAPDAASWGPNRIDIAVRGSDSGLWRKYWNGTSWVGWDSLGGYGTSDPSIVAWGVGRLDVFVRGTDNALWHKWGNGTSWAGWDSLGGSLTGGSDAASWSANRIDVFSAGSAGSLLHQWWDGTRWSGWESFAGPAASGGTGITSEVSAVSWGPGRIDVFARGTDNAVWHKWYDGAWLP